MILAALFSAVALFVTVPVAVAQDTGAGPLRLATVTRAPFSMVENGADTGFSIELWQALAAEIGRDTEILRVDSFGEMLDMVRQGAVDAAAANISITSEREAEMDFTQPIFAGGLQVMVSAEGGMGTSLTGVLLSRDLALAVAAAFGLLFAVGMLMWVFERKRQPYFDLPAHKALFPAFWWALNLLVNGGFEERQPRSAPGRVLAVALVVGSLFLVSAFVARITATMTVSAITSSVTSVNDLYGKRVGTTDGSTAAGFLDRREIRYAGYGDLDTLLADFETGVVDVVVFDAPILAYYAHDRGAGRAHLVGPVFLPESYGIALPSGSALAEPLNQSLLKLRETGAYEAIRKNWFGPSNG
jgi:polar amino acid transport system substrate-binding protein